MIKNSKIFFCDKRKLKISSSVINKFKKFEKIIKKQESGGILLGRVYREYDEIEDISFPHKLDKSGPFSFLRAKAPAQKVINSKWKESKGEQIYLGEWHTHNEEDPCPSGVDKKMICETRRDTKMEIEYLYLIIVGVKNSFWVGLQDEKGLWELGAE